MPYCPNCGAETEADAAYCGSCGARLEGEALPPPPAAPPRPRPPWVVLGGIIALVALVVGGVVVYNAVTGDGDGQERRPGREEVEVVATASSPTAPAAPEPTVAVEDTPLPEPTPPRQPTAVPPPSGHVTPEEAIAAWVAPREYAGDCSTTTVEEDVGKVCSSFFEGSGSQLVYTVGLTFSEFGEWLLLERQGDETWLAVDSAPVGGVLESPWALGPEPSVIDYNLPEQAVTVYLEQYGLEYVGDCEYADLETDIGSYCSILWEDRGDQIVYAVGPVFSEPEVWLLLVDQGENGGWVVVDAADFVPGPQDTVPPWP